MTKTDRIMQPIPEPKTGQIWQHLKSGRLYRILATEIEMAGRLRHQNPGGCLHTYECLSTGRIYCRLTSQWEDEQSDFKQIQFAKSRAGELVMIGGGL